MKTNGILTDEVNQLSCDKINLITKNIMLKCKNFCTHFKVSLYYKKYTIN